MELGYNLRKYWNIDFENINFLNNGSFGATPKSVLEKMHEIEYLLESEPVHFFMTIYPEMMYSNICVLADFLNTKYDNLVLTDNATSGVNTILRNLMFELNENDEIIFFNHIYPAVRNTIYYICEKRKISFKEIQIPFPEYSNDILLEKLESNLSSKTKIVVVDHISSPTSIVFPVKEIIDLCHKNNVRVIVDGAHAPGMLDLNLDELKADWYVGNCHKWLFAGKGTAFIYSSSENFSSMKPLVISNDYQNGYRKEFDWVGTRNPSAWLSLTHAIGFYNNIGREQLNSYNLNLMKQTADLYLSEFSFDRLNLNNNSYLISLPFPYVKKIEKDTNQKLRNYFYTNYRIEIMFVVFNNEVYMRYSAQVFNTLSESYKLIEATKDYKSKLLY